MTKRRDSKANGEVLKALKKPALLVVAVQEEQEVESMQGLQ